MVNQTELFASNRTTFLEQLQQSLETDWVHLRNARSRSLAKLAEAREALKDFDSEDTSIIVSGSLARDEYTDDSDFDWSLLIDGVCDPEHHRVVREIRSRVAKLTNKPPGPERTFGDMVFSHDLVHHIGGEDDTNRNTTQRLLLVLESRVVGRTEAHARVRRNVLNRYLLEDRGFWREQSRFRVPRFLQNDLARYWRTVAVDFSYKRRNRGGEGWAIRNLKLRMSRKLVYVAGLLACYRCHMDSNPERRGKFFEEPNSKQQVISRLEQVFNMTPLENIAEALLRFPHLYGPARQIFDSYDGFVGVLSDSDKRRHLELLAEDGDSDELYQSARALSHTFRDGLLEFFFDPESEMEILTKNFGVF